MDHTLWSEGRASLTDPANQRLSTNLYRATLGSQGEGKHRQEEGPRGYAYSNDEGNRHTLEGRGPGRIEKDQRANDK
jgi:hypothetical protein